MSHNHPSVDPPSLLADFGAGATIVGSDTAMRITTGPGFNGTGTLMFSSPANRVAAAMNESAGGTDGNPYPMGARQLDSLTVQVHSQFPVLGGDVITVTIATYP